MYRMIRNLLPAGLILVLACSCADPQSTDSAFEDEPLKAVGHGVFINADGEEIIPDQAFISAAQRYYISTLMGRSERDHTATDADYPDISETEKLIYSLVEDPILANALFLDWLIASLEPADQARLTNHNNALRWHYYLDILKQQPPGLDGTWTKGIPRDIAEHLEREDIQVLAKTNASGREYRAQCRAANVPVPEGMFTPEWNPLGVIDDVFISTGSQAELWIHTSTSPPGACLALPRYPIQGGGAGNEATLLGIICLGTQSNNACYFDNPQGRTFTRDEPVDIDQFVGGADLVTNGQGVCTDCHAGENPFVVHPDRTAFSGLTNTLMPGGWTDPLVHPSWPQNPGPTNLLDAESSPARCDSCHQAGVTGRFPDVSTELSGYCNVVLSTALSGPPQGTMPPGGNASMYTDHINALQSACQAPPQIGVEVDVDYDDDRNLISPPLVIDPLYQCATRVSVRSAMLDAEVSLLVNGAVVDTLIARSPYQEIFDVPELVAGDIVTARQSFNGTLSDESPTVEVRDHLDDYPGGLPAPEIDPTVIHECANLIAVRHVPGAKLTVLTNSADPRTWSTSTDWTAGRPGKTPFNVGDTFTATASLCDDRSPSSSPEIATNAPASLSAPGFNPDTVYAGQQLVTIQNLTHGARTRVAETGFGMLGEFSTPVTWRPDFDVATPLGRPLAAGESLTADQSLCTDGPSTTTEPAGRCERLPAPRIRTPLVGDSHVVVTQSVPGARIRVYDQNNDELGDGSGTIILLTRTLTGADTLTVIQQLEDCVSRTGYRVSVRNPDWKPD